MTLPRPCKPTMPRRDAPEQGTPMELTKFDVEDILRRAFRRCDAARAAGGVSHRDRVEGIAVPADWELDIETMYWLPPNIALCS